MMYSDIDIENLISNRSLQVEPLEMDNIQPASIDVRLGDSFLQMGLTPKTEMNGYPVIDTENFDSDIYTPVYPDDGVVTICSGQFLLGSTVEYFSIPSDISARFEGKSSLGRIGLLTHVTAGFIDPGFEGEITLELTNLSPHIIALRPGMKIGQVCFYKMESSPNRAYGSANLGSHYQGQRGPTPPNFDRKSR